jgi:hypothetical protein
MNRVLAKDRLVATYNDQFGVTKRDPEFFDIIVEILRRRKKR